MTKVLHLFCIILCYTVLSSGSTIIKGSRQEIRKFPEGFLFGSSTAAYQVEGGWNEDGKSENIWDHLTHTRPEMVKDMSNGDIAADSYHQIERDVEMMRELGLDFYRTSISWSRVLPTGFTDFVNEAGLQYYKKLFDEMLKYNIEPMGTLYHWDLPQRLQNLGGWANPQIVDWFADYARVVFEHLGDRVKYWITINEAYMICRRGYSGSMAPSLNESGVGDYMCVRNILLAHAKAYHIYDKEFRPNQKGIIGFSIYTRWVEPESDEYIDEAEEQQQFVVGLYAHPIFSKTGDYPPMIKEKIAAKSKSQGFTRSRLPELTPEEVDYIKGTSDFFGVNHYSSYYVYKNDSLVYPVPSYEDDVGSETYQLPEWQIGESTFNKFTPWGFPKIINWIKDAYNNPPIMITENGFATRGGLIDEDRIRYITSYLDALLDAIEDGADVRAYTVWSIMDNFEWLEGYTECFGLYEVDFSDPMRMRTPRKSAFFYKNIVSTRQLDPNYEPPIDAIMTIDDGH